MVSVKQVNNLFNSKAPSFSTDSPGGIGFDNPRQNIDPNIITKNINTEQITISGNGRWLRPYHFALPATSQVVSGGRCMMALFENPTTSIINGITVLNGATVSGAFRVALYNAVSSSTADTCSGATKIIDSASTTQVGTNQGQTVTISATTLLPGLYYVGVQFEDMQAATYLRNSNVNAVTGWYEHFTQTYGAFPAVAPATTQTGSAVPGLLVRRQS